MPDKTSEKKTCLLMWVIVCACLFSTVTSSEGCIKLNSNSDQADVLSTNKTCENDGDIMITSSSRRGIDHLSDAGCCLTSLPKNLCDFRNIQRISLSHNNIRSIGNLSCLVNLTILDLSHNKIQALKTGVFDSLTKLVDINLSHNLIHTVELGVFHPGLASLKVVHLDNNNLTSADLWVFNTSSALSYFSVAHNRITHFTNEANFYFPRNKLVTMDGFGLLFDLRYNNFSVWNFTFFVSLSTGPMEFARAFINHQYNFDFRNNPLLCDCRIFQMLLLVKTTDSFFKQFFLFDITCQSPLHLAGKMILNVNPEELVCNITDRCPPGCFCQEQPYHQRMLVDCRGAGLHRMPEHLPKHHSLFLQFQNNRIERLPSLPYVNHITSLNVSNNVLTSISASFFEESRHLKKMDLSNNKLQYLPETVQRFDGDELVITNNPWLCNCSNIWLWQWLQSKSNIRHKWNITCSSSEGASLRLKEVATDNWECEVHTNEKIIIMASFFSFVFVSLAALCGYFKYELMTVFYLYLYPKFRLFVRSRKMVTHDLDVFVMLDEGNDEARIWVRDFMMPYLRARLQTSFIPFSDSLPGDVTAETNLEKIRKCSTIIAYVSPSFLEKTTCVHELQEAYCCMVKEGNGKLLLIRQTDVQVSKLKRGNIKALLRLGHSMEADDPVFREGLESSSRF